MADPSTTRAFLEAEVTELESFGFVAVIPSGNPMHAVEVTRGEDGAVEVRVPGRPPIMKELPAEVREKLHECGFTSEDPTDPTRHWSCAAADAGAAVELAQRVLGVVFGEPPERRLDIAHGSHRTEHETRQKLAEVREQIEKALATLTDGQTPERDADEDYMLRVGDVHVMVAPRVTPPATLVVRVFAITNVAVNVAPELGLLLARLNFNSVFGRFALDAENRSIWVDEILLGEYLNDEELRYTVGAVAAVADEWDDRLKQLFGGQTYQEVMAQRIEQGPAPNKPGHGFYL